MANSIQRHFAVLPDPRRAQGKRHRLSDMMVIAVCAVICCADRLGRPPLNGSGSSRAKTCLTVSVQGTPCAGPGRCPAPHAASW
jgi:hypothetical protein